MLSKPATSGARPSLLCGAVSSSRPRASSYTPGSPLPPGTLVPRPLARLHTDPPPTTGLPPPVPILQKQCRTRHLQQALLTTQGAQGPGAEHAPPLAGHVLPLPARWSKGTRSALGACGPGASPAWTRTKPEACARRGGGGTLGEACTPIGRPGEQPRSAPQLSPGTHELLSGVQGQEVPAAGDGAAAQPPPPPGPRMPHPPHDLGEDP